MDLADCESLLCASVKCSHTCSDHCERLPPTLHCQRVRPGHTCPLNSGWRGPYPGATWHAELAQGSLSLSTATSHQPPSAEEATCVSQLQKGRPQATHAGRCDQSLPSRFVPLSLSCTPSSGSTCFLAAAPTQPQPDTAPVLSDFLMCFTVPQGDTLPLCMVSLKCPASGLPGTLVKSADFPHLEGAL